MVVTAQAPSATTNEQRILLSNIRWQTYRALAEDLDGCRIRMTYDRGDLEILTISYGHEGAAKWIGRLIETLTEELNIPIAAAGSTTLSRDDLERALEPDECFYIHNEHLVRGKHELELENDPPPDLSVEVDINRSSVRRMGIYAALGVPEVWRFDGTDLHVYRLGESGEYQEVQQSVAFPFLPMKEFADWILKRGTIDQTTLARSFRDWVRREVLPKYQQGG